MSKKSCGGLYSVLIYKHKLKRKRQLLDEEEKSRGKVEREKFRSIVVYSFSISGAHAVSAQKNSERTSFARLER